MTYRSITCPCCQWITQRNGLVPKLCDHCESPFQAAMLQRINTPYADPQPRTGPKHGAGQSAQRPSVPKSRLEFSQPQPAQRKSLIMALRGRYRLWGSHQRSADGPAANRSSSSHQQSQPRAHSPSSPVTESQDSNRKSTRQVQASPDGDTEDTTARAKLVNQINKYQQMMNSLDAAEDPTLFKLLQDHIAAAKSAVI